MELGLGMRGAVQPRHSLPKPLNSRPLVDNLGGEKWYDFQATRKRRLVEREQRRNGTRRPVSNCIAVPLRSSWMLIFVSEGGLNFTDREWFAMSGSGILVGAYGQFNVQGFSNADMISPQRKNISRCYRGMR